MRAVSSGEWIVESLVGVDIRQDLVYVTETYDSPLERHLYPLPLLKKRRKRGKVVLCWSEEDTVCWYCVDIPKIIIHVVRIPYFGIGEQTPRMTQQFYQQIIQNFK